MTTQTKSLRFADQLAESPYAFPGGYPKFAITSDGACLCHTCCKTERELIATTTGDDGWNVVGLDLNFEDDHLLCNHCGEKIESAYGAQPSLVLMDSHGVYIPQLWCADIDETQAKIIGADWDAVKICSSGPDHEYYWDAWTSILDDVSMTDKDGIVWRLYQDGDLWEIPDGKLKLADS